MKPADLRDPWDRRYRYCRPGRHGGEDPFDLWSLGPDGRDDTGDEIANWQLSAAGKGLRPKVGE